MYIEALFRTEWEDVPEPGWAEAASGWCAWCAVALAAGAWAAGLLPIVALHDRGPVGAYLGWDGPGAWVSGGPAQAGLAGVAVASAGLLWALPGPGWVVLVRGWVALVVGATVVVRVAWAVLG